VFIAPVGRSFRPIRRRIVAVIGAVALAVAVAACESSGSSTASHGATTRAAPFVFPSAAAQQALDEFVKAGQTPGAVLAVSVKGAPPTILASGVSDPRAQTPMKADDVFAAASITKTSTAALVLQLVREAKVNLDAPINTYGLNVPNGDQITVGQLLSHTSGIPPLGGERFYQPRRQTAGGAGNPNH